MEKVMKNKLALFLFIVPALLLFIGIILVPIAMSLRYSFMDWDGITQEKFIGFENYISLFTNKSIGFPKTLGNALLLAFLSVAIQLPLALFLAISLAGKKRGGRFFVSVFFLPVLISTTVIGQLWLKIYNPNYGLINVGLRAIGLEDLTRTWLGDAQTALFAVFIPILWQYVGYHMLLLYAGVKSIPTDLHEAARIDGASERQIALRITLPLLKPILQVCVIFAVTGSLKAFDLIYILTNGGPAHASEVPSTLMVSMIFGRNRYGLGSSIAIFIILLCFAFAALIKGAFSRESEL